MRLTFEELQLVVSTAMLLPALIALIVLGWKKRLSTADPDQWSPLRYPERDWWSEEDSP